MSFQEQAIQMTKRSIDDIFRQARAMPADKIEWSPLDEGRTVLDQLQECAQAPTWFIGMIESRSFPQMSPEQMQEFGQRAAQERSQWKTVDECERVCKENSEKLFEVIRKFPDKDLNVTIVLPFAGGIERTLAEMIMGHYWNLVYHIGQINYLQTLYGDREMH